MDLVGEVAEAWHHHIDYLLAQEAYRLFMKNQELILPPEHLYRTIRRNSQHKRRLGGGVSLTDRHQCTEDAGNVTTACNEKHLGIKLSL